MLENRPSRSLPSFLHRLPAILVAVLAIALLAALPNGVSSAEASTTCDKVAGLSGSDSAPGTHERPFLTTQKLVDSLAPGETGCLRNGTYRGNVDFRRGGSSSARLRLQSYPGERATILGQVRVLENARFVEVRTLDLDGSAAPRCGSGESCTIRPSPVVYGDDARFADNDVTNGNTAICFIVGSGSMAPTDRAVFEHNRVHDCGRRPATNHDHGFYLENSVDARIEHNLIHDNVDRGIQFYPNSVRTVVKHNVLDGNGQNIHFGRSSRDNVVESNLITNARLRFNVESWEATGTGNVVRSNCINGANFSGTPSASGVQTPQVGFTVVAPVYVDPQYRDRGSKDFRLRSTSPCGTLFGDVDAGPRSDETTEEPPEEECDRPVAIQGAPAPGEQQVEEPDVVAPNDDSPDEADAADENDSRPEEDDDEFGDQESTEEDDQASDEQDADDDAPADDSSSEQDEKEDEPVDDSDGDDSEEDADGDSANDSANDDSGDDENGDEEPADDDEGDSTYVGEATDDASRESRSSTGCGDDGGDSSGSGSGGDSGSGDAGSGDSGSSGSGGDSSSGNAGSGGGRSGGGGGGGGGGGSADQVAAPAPGAGLAAPVITPPAPAVRPRGQRTRCPRSRGARRTAAAKRAARRACERSARRASARRAR